MTNEGLQVSLPSPSGNIGINASDALIMMLLERQERQMQYMLLGVGIASIAGIVGLYLLYSKWQAIRPSAQLGKLAEEVTSTVSEIPKSFDELMKSIFGR